MTNISSITFVHILNILEKNTKIEIDEMLTYASLDKEIVYDEEKFIDSKTLSTIFRYCAQKTNDDTLALKIGTSTSYHSLGVLGYLMHNARTLKEVIEKFDYYQNLISSFFNFKLIKDEEFYKLVIYINENPMIPVPRSHAEVHLSAIVTILNQILDKKIYPDKMHFSFKADFFINKYEEVFGKNLFFEKDENACFFGFEQLQMKVINSIAVMLKYFEGQAESILLSSHSNSYFEKVKKEILKNIGESEITVDFISKKLLMSPRSLQYKLKDENKKFRDALLEVRMQLANHLIKKSSMDFSTIALYLGYSEASSFYRAYKKYFNTTPKIYSK